MMGWNYMPDYATNYAYAMPAQPMQRPQQTAQQYTDMIWVQGVEAAKSYIVAPGKTVPLWDSENQKIYLKSADASGMPSMRTLSWTEDAVKQPQSAPVPSPITREEFDALVARVDAMTFKGERKVSEDV